MIPFPITFLGNETVFSPIDDIGPDLWLWLNPNDTLDLGGDGTADRINNVATVPMLPEPATSQNTNAGLIIENGYNFDADSIQFVAGSQTYYQVNTYPEIQIDYTKGFSFAFWAKLPASSVGNMVVFDSVDPSRALKTGIKAYFNSGAFYFGILNTLNQGYSFRILSSFNDNKWHFYHVVYQPGDTIENFLVYIDGIMTPFSTEFNSTVVSKTINEISPTIGGSVLGTNYFIGDLGHVYMFASGLNSEEAQILNNYYAKP